MVQIKLKQETGVPTKKSNNLEDELFVSLYTEARSRLSYKLFKVKKRYLVGKTSQDLIHDSFIIYRQILDKQKLKLGDNITYKELTAIIFTIINSRFYNFINGKAPRYFEQFSNLETISLNYVTDEWEQPSVNIKSNLDVDYIVKNIITDKFRDIFKLLQLGYSGAEISKKLKLSEGMVSNHINNIRRSLMFFLGKEYEDFCNNEFITTDNRVLRNKTYKI